MCVIYDIIFVNFTTKSFIGCVLHSLEIFLFFIDAVFRFVKRARTGKNQPLDGGNYLQRCVPFPGMDAGISSAMTRLTAR